MSDDLATLRNNPTVDVVLAGRLLGFARNASYEARKRGDIPAIKVGRRYRVLSADLMKMLKIEPAEPKSNAA